MTTLDRGDVAAGSLECVAADGSGRMKVVWATFHYPSSTDEKGWIAWPKPKRRLCLVRHGMIKGPEHTGFVLAGRGFKQHFRINDPMPLFPEEAQRLTEETAIWRER